MRSYCANERQRDEQMEKERKGEREREKRSERDGTEMVDLMKSCREN